MTPAEELAVRRSKLIDRVNVALAEIAKGEERVAQARANEVKVNNDARSNRMTAEVELGKLKHEYREAVHELAKKLPNPLQTEGGVWAPTLAHSAGFDK